MKPSRNSQNKRRTRPTKEQLSEQKKSNLDFATDVLVAILTDGVNSLPHYRFADYRRDVEMLRRRIACEGEYFLIKILPQLWEGLSNLLERRHGVFPGFQSRDGLPVFMRTVLQHAIVEETEYIKFVYQVSVAFKKVQGQYDKAILQGEFEKFVETDRSLERINDDLFAKHEKLLNRAAHFATELFRDNSPDENPEDWIPRPGPGATNTPQPSYMKYEPHVLYRNIDEVMPYDEWFYHSPIGVFADARSYLSLTRVEDGPTSRFCFVPKTALKPRGICIEENEVQYLQQGIRRGITRIIERHPLYRRRIVLNDQRVNGWMALSSSEHRRFATIDLSEASDRVARKLVHRLFGHLPIWTFLDALSTRVITPPVECKNFGPIEVHKFAPMGSALCFPVMSLTIMFLIRAAIQLSPSKYPHLDSTNVFVYGDDIVVPSQHYELVCEVLSTFGLKVNKEKSFVSSYFRESCGVHAHKGVDITPVFVRKYPRSSSQPSLVSLMESEKQLWSKQLFSTAAVLRRYGARLKPKWFWRLNYVPLESPVIGWRRPQSQVHMLYPKYHTRWDKDTQQYLFSANVLYIKPSKVGLVKDSAAALRWVAEKPEPFQSRMLDLIAEKDAPVVVRRQWVPRVAIHI